MEWQVTQLTSFRACPLRMRPACVGWFRWQARQVRSASATGSLAVKTESLAFLDSGRDGHRKLAAVDLQSDLATIGRR